MSRTPRTTVLYARVTPEVKKAVEQIAEQDHRTVSQALTLMIQSAQREREKETGE